MFAYFRNVLSRVRTVDKTHFDLISSIVGTCPNAYNFSCWNFKHLLFSSINFHRWLTARDCRRLELASSAMDINGLEKLISERKFLLLSYDLPGNVIEL